MPDVFDNKKIVIKKKKLENGEFQTFFGTNLSVYDLACNSDALVTALQNLKIIHSRENGGCGQRIKIKFEKNFYRFWCNCGMILIYPPRTDRNNCLLLKYFPKKKFDADYKAGLNNGFGQN